MYGLLKKLKTKNKNKLPKTLDKQKKNYYNFTNLVGDRYLKERFLLNIRIALDSKGIKCVVCAEDYNQKKRENR
jgi:hypothetical protein